MDGTHTWKSSPGKIIVARFDEFRCLLHVLVGGRKIVFIAEQNTTL